nr:disulfide bond formation protein DsbD [Vibrio metoecus]
MVAVVVIEFSVMRCQPLRRALCLIHKNQQVVIFDSFGISFRFCRQFNIVRRCLTKWQCFWRCRSSVIASLKY